jgi:hypothetical protein
MTIWTIVRWFTKSWWQYLLEKPLGDFPIERIICRAKGHPAGPVWYNMTGSEPDMRCKHCGDYIG